MTSARIDVHSHYLPDFYREALAAAGHTRPDGMPAIPSWSEEAALATMDRLGIRTAVVSISSPGVHFGDDAAARALARRVNEEGARLKAAHPGRFGFFASTPLPDVEGALAEVRHAFDVLHADGVVLESNFHGVYLGDERLAPLYAELDRRAAVVFLHPTSPACPCHPVGTPGCTEPKDMALGYPRPMLEFIFETTRTVTQMILSGTLARYPNLRVIVPHAGAALPILGNRIELLTGLAAKSSGAPPVDVRTALRRLHYDLAGAPVPEQLGALLQVADPGRIFYGSDWPFTPVEVCEELASQLEATTLLEGPLRESVMRGNAALVFPALTR